MRKLIVILLVLMTSFSFAETLTFMANHDTVPMKLQGEWTQTAYSRNQGRTWIDGISVPVQITDTILKINDSVSTVVLTSEFIDEEGRSGFVLKLVAMEELFEFWFIYEDSVALIVHKYLVEVLRCRLVR